MWITLLHRGQAINMNCIGRIEITRTRKGYGLRCDMSSESSMGGGPITIACYPTQDMAERTLIDILENYNKGTKIYELDGHNVFS